MDYTKKNKIRPEKDFNKMAASEYKLLYRQDSEDIFTEMINEKQLNHAECILVRSYFEHALRNITLGQYASVNKTSYYHLAFELVEKIVIKENFNHVSFDIAKRNKLNINEMEALSAFMISCVGLGLTMATLKSSIC